MTHKEWLDNEYKLWVEALQSSTVDNFKQNPQVKRMLGEVPGDAYLTKEVEDVILKKHDLISKIDSIGFGKDYWGITGTCTRMIYWALQVLKKKPKSIVDIGCGSGQFYAILHALGYTGEYFIYDLPEVKNFQSYYLEKVEQETGLQLPLLNDMDFEFLVSLYALGEFDDETKNFYVENVVNKCKHGFVIWNAHSGASTEIPFTFKYKAEKSQIEDSTKITW